MTETGGRNVLAKLEMKLNQEGLLSGQMASSFHGVLMELLPEDYAAELHAAKRHPYAQHLEKRGNTWYWVVAALNEDTRDRMLREILMPLTEFTLKKHQITIHVLEKSYQELSEQELSRAFYQGKASRYLRMQFVTPTAFKQNGRYVNYPDIRALFSNLMRRYETANEAESMWDEETLTQLTEKAVVSRYELRSAVFNVEGIKIPSFLGKLTLRMDGTQTMTNFAEMLLHFGSYSGVGVKTALGMGAMQILAERTGDS